MDLLTQGILGAATAQLGAQRQEVRTAALAGFVAGLIPDADALIRSSEDPLLVLEYHRHFSHALVTTPVIALLAALLLWPFLRSRLAFPRLLLFTFLGVCLAGLLDACTSYGTHLLWPFTDERVAWSIIAIIDPLFTLALLLPLFISLVKNSPTAARIGLLLAGCYLLLGFSQQQRVQTQALLLAADRGHEVRQLLVKPTLGNLLLWRSVYQADGFIHVDAIRAGRPGNITIYPGAALPLLQPRAVSDLPRDSRAMQDLQRFAGFADGWLAIHPAAPDYIGDLRYAMLPNSTLPLWGIVIDRQQPEQAPAFVSRRELDPAMRRQFIDMLLGRPVPL